MRFLAIIFTFFALTAHAQTGHEGHNHPVNTGKVPNPAFASIQKDDWVIGNPKATVTLTEYASLSCGHCADFYMKVLPEITKKYIDTGKIQFVYRDFPLNAPALKGAMAVRCTAPEKRKELLNALYANQKKWAFNKDFETDLQTLAIQNGLKKKEFKKCMADKKLEEAVVKSRMDGVKELNVTGTPTLYVNGEKYIGAPDAAGLSAMIDKYLAAQ